MNANGRIRLAGLLAVAGLAAVVSFAHIRHLAMTHGHDAVSSALLPLIVDGAIVVATTSMVSARGWWLGWARVLLAAAVGATLAANMAYGSQYGWSGTFLWAWPAVAFFGCAELAIGMARKPVPVPEPVPAGRQADAGPRRQADARPLALVPGSGDADAAARVAWIESGGTLSDRKLAEKHGRSRTYWTPRIAAWQAEAGA